MKMMSATEWDIGSSWFCTFLLLHVVTAALLTRISNPLFESSDTVILWLFWQSSLIALIVFSSLLPALFSWQTKTASRTVIIGLLTLLMGYFISQSIDLEDGDPWTIRLLCLHPVAAFGYGVQEIGRLEDAGIGATWHSFETTDSPSGFTIRTALVFLWLDSILGTLLSWYLNRILPGNGEPALACTVPFQASYWFPMARRNAAEERAPLRGEPARIEQDIPVEPVSDHLRSQAELGNSIEIHNLRKVFTTRGCTVTALHSLNLSMHQGQVTALLGHNGEYHLFIARLLVPIKFLSTDKLCHFC